MDNRFSEVVLPYFMGRVITDLNHHEYNFHYYGLFRRESEPDSHGGGELDLY